jgi:phosphoglycerol transferase MdoB-like AlkP superfamily enzyme
MRRNGYDASFLYGGYGYFDNMNYFFENNGFSVLDRGDMERVRFENIWGVSDEDLFDRALGYFLDEARKRDWFRDTLFVVADHGARVYGKAGIPLRQTVRRALSACRPRAP